MVDPDVDAAALSAAMKLLLEALPVAEVIRGDRGDYALHAASRGWPVFPLDGKVPALSCPITRENSRKGLPRCPGGCGNDGHGVYDATTDLDKVDEWWTRMPWANIGTRLPKPLLLLDVDPRHGGDASLAVLENRYGLLPETREVATGRGDGGRHLYFLHPGGALVGRRDRLGPGLDILTADSYAVLPPSLHPESNQPYRWVNEAPFLQLPPWFVNLLRPEHRPVTPRRSRLLGGTSQDPAGPPSLAMSWSEILEPYGWHCLDPDGDADGARWRHPSATSSWSATIKYGCLFVYSTNTPFRPTAPGAPVAYTKFRAVALLNYGGLHVSTRPSFA